VALDQHVNGKPGANPPPTVQGIREAKASFVNLQTYWPGQQDKNLESFKASVRTLIDVVEEHGGQAVVMQSWAPLYNLGIEDNFEVFDTLGVPVVRVGEAFKKYREDFGAEAHRALFSDQEHAGHKGTWLQACLHYRFYTGNLAGDCPFNHPELSPTDSQDIADFADECVQESFDGVVATTGGATEIVTKIDTATEGGIPPADGSRPILKGTELKAEPNIYLPKLGQAYEDPVTGRNVTRATEVGTNGTKKFFRHEYSKRSPFSCDNKYMLAWSNGGWWHVVESLTGKYVRLLTDKAHMNGDCEPEWHPTKPEIIRYHFGFGGKFQTWEMNALTGNRELLFDLNDLGIQQLFPGTDRAWGASEGKWSDDFNRKALLIEDNRFKSHGVVLYDVDAKDLVVKQVFDMSCDPDHATTCNSGQGFSVEWQKGGGGTQYFGADGSNHLMYDGNMHNDWAVCRDGHDVYVGGAYSGRDPWTGKPEDPVGYAFAYWPHNRASKRLWNLYEGAGGTAQHECGVVNGMVIHSCYADKHQDAWHHRSVFSTPLSLDMEDKNPEVNRIAQCHWQWLPQGGKNYLSEPQATASRDGSLIAFASNWGNAGGDPDVAETFVVEMPQGWRNG